MTKQQKQNLAYAVAAQAAELIEYWEEQINSGKHYDLRGIDVEEAREQIRKWMLMLPTGGYFPIALK